MYGRKSVNSLTEVQGTRNETGVNNCLGILKAVKYRVRYTH